MDEQADKRRARRYPVDIAVICRFRGQELPGQALNLSRGGLLVSTAETLKVGMTVVVCFVIPGAETVQFKSIVRHASQDLSLGIEFLEVLPHHQAQFAAYLETLD